MPSTRTTGSKGGAPPFPLLLLEGQRAFIEGLATRATVRLLLKHAPRGEGQPVLVLPGFMAGDRSTRFLRRTLRKLGYDPHPWLLGRNRGVGPSPGYSPLSNDHRISPDPRVHCSSGGGFWSGLVPL